MCHWISDRIIFVNRLKRIDSPGWIKIPTHHQPVWTGWLRSLLYSTLSVAHNKKWVSGIVDLKYSLSDRWRLATAANWNSPFAKSRRGRVSHDWLHIGCRSTHARSTPANTDCPYKDRWTRQHEHLVRLFFSAPNQFGLHCRRLIYCFFIKLWQPTSDLTGLLTVCLPVCVWTARGGQPEIASSVLDTVTLSPGPRFNWRHAGETRSRGWR